MGIYLTGVSLKSIMNGQTKQQEPKKPSVVGEVAKGVATGVAKKGAKAVLRRAGSYIAGKLGKTAALQAAASAVPGIGNAAAAIIQVASEILSKIKKTLSKIFSGFLKLVTGEGDTRKQIRNIAAGVAIVALGVGQPILAAASGLTAIGAQVSISGAQGISSGIAGVGQSFMYAVTYVAAPAIGIPLIVSLLVIPLAIIFIIFIINSGAYVVPEGPALFPSESLYIDVEKTAKASGPFGNGDLPERITYTITVTAIRSTLTNINFEWTCRVLSDFGQTCPSYSDVTVNGESQPNLLPPTPPQILSPTGDPYVITYSMLFRAGQFNDTATVDTFTVTADTEGVAGERASGSVTVIFGTPPTACIDFEPTNAPYIGEFQAAAAELASNVSYAAKLCSAGPIIARLKTEGPEASGACAGVTGSNIMFFNNCRYFRTHGQAFITYLFAHESGHLYAKRIPGDYSQFLTDNVPGEGHLPTYCISGQPPDWEDFAETIGDYVDNGRLGHLCAKPDQRPFRLCDSRFTRHCDFAQDVLF